jgi:hypothetical protein
MNSPKLPPLLTKADQTPKPKKKKRKKRVKKEKG